MVTRISVSVIWVLLLEIKKNTFSGHNILALLTGMTLFPLSKAICLNMLYQAFESLLILTTLY